MHRQVAEQLGFESRGEAYVRLLTEEETPRADAISIRFRDQYIGRLPMQQIKESLLGSGVYVGKRIELPNACVKAKIDKVYEKPKTVSTQMKWFR